MTEQLSLSHTEELCEGTMKRQLPTSQGGRWGEDYWNIAVPLGREFSAAIAKIASEQKSDEEY